MIELDAVPADRALDEALGGLAQQLSAAFARHDRDAAGATLATAIALTSGAGRHCRMSAEPAAPDHDGAAALAGMHQVRELLQLRRSLPLPAELRPRGATSYTTRAFEPGRDDAAWLEVNNRAFAWHPEQGGWTVDVLRDRQREPWFDPDGFLLADVDGRLAGFCWTKVHRDTEPVLGEIFVIAVDPDVHKGGLGRFLCVAGLDWLAAQGITTAMLYVEADNAPARGLYDSLGFTVHHAKRWWET